MAVAVVEAMRPAHALAASLGLALVLGGPGRAAAEADDDLDDSDRAFFSIYQRDGRYRHTLDGDGTLQTEIVRGTLHRINTSGVRGDGSIFLVSRDEDDKTRFDLTFRTPREGRAAYEILRQLTGRGFVDIEIDGSRGKPLVDKARWWESNTELEIGAGGPQVHVIVGAPTAELAAEVRGRFSGYHQHLAAPFASSEESIPLESLVADALEHGYGEGDPASDRAAIARAIGRVPATARIPRRTYARTTAGGTFKIRWKAGGEETFTPDRAMTELGRGAGGGRPTAALRTSLQDGTGDHVGVLIGGKSDGDRQLLDALFRELDRRGPYTVELDGAKGTEEKLDLAFRASRRGGAPGAAGVFVRPAGGGEAIPIETLMAAAVAGGFRPLPTGYGLASTFLARAERNAIAIDQLLAGRLRYPRPDSRARQTVDLVRRLGPAEARPAAAKHPLSSAAPGSRSWHDRVRGWLPKRAAPVRARGR